MSEPNRVGSETQGMEENSEEEEELEEGEVEGRTEPRDSEADSGEAEAGGGGERLTAVEETPIRRAPRKAARSLVLPRNRKVLFSDV